MRILQDSYLVFGQMNLMCSLFAYSIEANDLPYFVAFLFPVMNTMLHGLGNFIEIL